MLRQVHLNKVFRYFSMHIAHSKLLQAVAAHSNEVSRKLGLGPSTNYLESCDLLTH